MDAVFQSILSGAPFLLLHAGVTIAMLVVGVTLYMWMTPYEDIAQIRAGNGAAGIALGGAILGMAIPLAITLRGSVNLWDIVLWGILIVILQMAVFKVVDLILKDLPKRIENGETGAAVLLSSAKISVGAINAAAIAV
ncbi:MAG: DUF350 domain-containing protein [Rhodospirillaceae bacterium]|nr:DUF350 domain-containing protein [Rhodospirillaceae bacterium]MXW93015.1 DUF350 domain-containing protein [Rhodospirillaceae bacterium]MYB14242.1 DUF350 domain-containing protein [Rhodospirillaceae bacterium]MYI49290.1 DUF350 domain-containing protein [Rhodospirillaceae bacterium]